MDRFQATQLIDIKGTVKKLRTQRYRSLIIEDQYIFCYKAIAAYARESSYLGNTATDRLKSNFTFLLLLILKIAA
jgi:hypothetical protein